MWKSHSIIYVKEYFYMFSSTPKDVAELQNKTNHWISENLMIICLNSISEERFSLNGNVIANLKFPWALGGLSEGTQGLKQSKGTWTLEYLKGTWAFGHLSYSGTWALRVLSHLDTQAFVHLKHWGTWASGFDKLLHARACVKNWCLYKNIL